MEYQQEYVELLKRYRETEVDAEEIGYMIAKMAQYFAEYNMKLVAALIDNALSKDNFLSFKVDLVDKPKYFIHMVGV